MVFAEPTNVTSVVDLLNFANNTTNGVYGYFTLFAIFIVLFSIFVKRMPTPHASLMSLFVTTVMAAFFSIIGFVPSGLALLLVVLTVGNYIYILITK